MSFLAKLADLSEIDEQLKKGLMELYEEIYEARQPYKEQIKQLDKEINGIINDICLMYKEKLYFSHRNVIQKLTNALYDFEHKKNFMSGVVVKWIH